MRQHFTSLNLKRCALVSSIVFLTSCGGNDKNDNSRQRLSPPEESVSATANTSENKCYEFADVLKDLQSARQRYEAAAQNGDDTAMRKNLLQASYLAEKYEILCQGRGEVAIEQLEARYNKLRDLVLAKNYHGEGYSRQPENLAPYSEIEAKSVRDVANRFGNLFIAGSPKDADGDYVPTTIKADEPLPWSGYWYPRREDHLYAGDQSPLGKLDALAKKFGRLSNIVGWEQQRAKLDTSDWSGLCDALAIAAVLESEPRGQVQLEGITFTVADQKALLVKKYEGYNAVRFGEPYRGDYHTDGTIQDLRPEAFHTIVLAQLGERRLPIVVDDDPGFEVWFKPLFEMRYVIKRDKIHPAAFIVTAWPRLVNNRVEITNRLTDSSDIKSPKYEYRLYVDEDSRDEQGRFLVIFSEWVSGSQLEHPDMVLLPEPNAAVQPKNPELAENLDLIDEIVTQPVPPVKSTVNLE